MRTDEHLLAAAARGDDRAFAVFYRRHLDGVVAFLRRRVPAPEQAFDLAAETFAVVALTPGAYRGEGPATRRQRDVAHQLAPVRQRQIEQMHVEAIDVGRARFFGDRIRAIVGDQTRCCAGVTGDVRWTTRVGRVCPP